MSCLQNDCFVRKWLPNFHFLLHSCIPAPACLYSCIHAYSQFFTASKSDLKHLKRLRISFKWKMSKQGVTGQYWSILDNISQCLTILGYIWQYCTISECSLQYHISDKSELKYSLEQYWAIQDNIGQYLYFVILPSSVQVQYQFSPIWTET